MEKTAREHVVQMAEGRILIKGGRVIDPASGRDEVVDILIHEGRVMKMSSRIRSGKAEVLSAAGQWVLPGMIDLHVHFRDPGYEYKETILSGSRAAVAGGFTAAACMPNTDPVNDNPAVTRTILNKARRAGLIRVYPVGCITAGQQGEKMAEIGGLVDAGCCAISDDGRPVMNAGVMRRAMEYSRHFGVPVISHCEDLNLAEGGVIHEGVVSTRLGLRPIPASAEETMAARDITLCRQTGARLHLAHVSTRGTVELVRAAKEQGLPVTCEVTPHHLMLTDEAVTTFDTATKVNPPLRSPDDVSAVRDALRDGTVDAVATDHAPHGLHEKELEYDAAAFGMVGLETALPLVLKMVEEKVLPLGRAVEALTWNPARILGVSGGRIEVGEPADLTLVDPGIQFTVNPETFFTKGRSSPFRDWRLKGKVTATIVGGRVVFRDGFPVEPELM
jgi:dihydroorotase